MLKYNITFRLNTLQYDASSLLQRLKLTRVMVFHPLGNVDLTSEFNDLDPKNNKTDVFHVSCWYLCLFLQRVSTGYVYLYHCCGVAFTESVLKKQMADFFILLLLFFLSLCEHKQPGCHACFQQ